MARNTKVILLALGGLFLAGCARSDRASVRMDHPQWKKGAGAASQKMPNPGTPAILPKTHLAAAQLLLQQGSVEEAITQYRKAIALNHDYAAAYHHLGVLLAQLGRREEAATMLGRTVELRPNEALAQNNFGYALMLLERWEQAAEALGRAVQIEPQFARAQVNLGMVYSKLGRFDDALASFRTVLPEPDAQYNLGLMFRGQQQYEKAAKAFERALALNPDFTAATTQLAQITKRLPCPIEAPTESNVVAEKTTIEPTPDEVDATPPTPPTALADSGAPRATLQGDGDTDHMEPASPKTLEPSDEARESPALALAQTEPTPVDENGFPLFDEDGFPCNEETDAEVDFAVEAADEFKPVAESTQLSSDQGPDDVIASSPENYATSFPVDEDGYPLFDEDGFPCGEEVDEEADFAVAAADEFEPVAESTQLSSEQGLDDFIASSPEDYATSFPVDEDGFPLFDEDGFPCDEVVDEEVDFAAAVTDEFEPVVESTQLSSEQGLDDFIASSPENYATSFPVDEDGYPLFDEDGSPCNEEADEEVDFSVAAADEFEPVAESRDPSLDQGAGDVITRSISDNVATSVVDENGFPLFGVRRAPDRGGTGEEAASAVAAADESGPVADSPKAIVRATAKRDIVPPIEFPAPIAPLSNELFFADDDIFENDFLVSVIPTTPLAELGPFGSSMPDEDDEPCWENEEGIPPVTIALRIEQYRPAVPIEPVAALAVQPVQVVKYRSKPNRHEELRVLGARLADIREEIKCLEILAAHEPARHWLNVSFADAAVQTWPELTRGIVTLSPISVKSPPARVMSAKVVDSDAKPRKSMAMTIVPDEDESGKTAPAGFEEPKTKPAPEQRSDEKDADTDDDFPPDWYDKNPHAGLTFEELLDLLSIASNDLACWKAVDQEPIRPPTRRGTRASAPHVASPKSTNAERGAQEHSVGVASRASNLSAPMPRRFRLGRDTPSPPIKPRRD